LTLRATHLQNFGHVPGRYPPFGLFPAGSQALRYGFLTANGNEGGRVGVNVGLNCAATIKSRQLSIAILKRYMIEAEKIC
jgi:hypothetical protein